MRLKTALWGLGFLSVFVVAYTAFFSLPAHAATGINQQLNFQGKVVKSDGTNIPDGTYNMEFKVYQDGTGTGGGTLKWTEDWLVGGSGGVTVTSGTFDVNLGAHNAFGNSVDWNQDTLYLSFQVGNTSSCTITTTFQSNCSGDGEMSPYIRLTAVPYAINANKVGGLTASQLVQLSPGSPQSGNINISGTLTAAGASSLTLGTASTNAGAILFQSSGGSNVITLQAPTTNPVSSYTLKLPTTAPALSQCLQNDGTTIGQLTFGSCGSGSGVSTVGTIDSQTASANGAVISGSSLVLQSATGSVPGLINTGTQTFAGAKDFTSNSTTGFQIQNSSNNGRLLNVDTTNSVISVGVSAPNAPTVTNSSGGTLAQGKTYLYEVTSLSGTAESVATVTTPSSISIATTATTRTNTVSWSNVTGATSYKLYRSIDGGATWQVNAIAQGTTTTTATDDGSALNWGSTATPPATSTTKLAVSGFQSCANIYSDANSNLVCGAGAQDYISRLSVFGHSIAAGVGSIVSGGRWTSRLARMLHTSDNNKAVGGSVLAYDNGGSNPGGYENVLQYITSNRTGAPYVPNTDSYILEYGLNDVGLGVGYTTIDNALRTVISRSRAASIFEETDSSFVFTGAGWATSTCNSACSGTGYKTSATSGNSFTVTVPADFPGGTVAVGLVTNNAGTGGSVNFTMDGNSSGSATTAGVNASGRYSPVIKRFTGLSAGSHTIVGTIASATGSVGVDYWQIEAPNPPLTIVPLQYRAVSYASYGSGTCSGNGVACQPTDTDVATLNTNIQSVAAEFDSNVITPNFDNAMQKNATNFYSDGLHPNDQGYAKLAVVAYQAISQATVNLTGLASSVGGVTDSTDTKTFQNGANSTKGLLVNNSNGAQVLGVDTLNSLVNIQGSNSTATLGSEQMGSTNNFSSNWSGTGWTFSSSSAAHTSGTAPAVYSTTAFTPTANTTYQVSYTFTGGNGTDGITAGIGGATGPTIYSQNNSSPSETEMITTSGTVTGGLSFTPTAATWTGSITSVSIMKLTASTPVLQILNSAATSGLDVRASTDFGDTFVGTNAGLSNTTGYDNTALGMYALLSNTTGLQDTAVGTYALSSNTSGGANVANGYSALFSNTTGQGNVANGYEALYYNTTGGANTATGYESLITNSNGTYNTAQGYLSLYSNTIGNDNTGTGYGSLYFNNIGSFNTAVGWDALLNNTSGNGNSAIGLYAGYGVTGSNANTSGSYNSFYGYESAPGTATQLQNASAIGAFSAVSQSNSLALGCTTVTTGCTSNTEVGIGTGTPGATLDIQATSSTVGLNVNTTGSGNLLQLANGGASVASVTSTGVTIFKNSTNSSSAFQIQNSNGAPIFNVDTTTPNLVTNPGFETGVTGWAGAGTGASCVQNTATKNRIYFGQASLKCTTATSGNTTATVSNFTSTLAAGNYNFSFYAMGDNAATLATTVTFTGGAGTCTLNNTSITTTGFQRYSCNVTTSGTTTGIVMTTSTLNAVIYIDSVQLTAGATLTPYQIGSLQLRGIINNPVTIQPLSSSTTALQVINTSSINELTVDTYNNVVQIGSLTSNANNIQLVLNNYNTTADPTAAGNGAMYYNASTNSLRCRVNGAWQSCGPQSVKVGADVAVSTTTASNITGLTFGVTASTDYKLSCDLFYQSAATTTGARFGLNGPATPTAVIGNVQEWTNTGAVTPTFVAFNAYGAVTGSAAVTAATTNYPVHIEATFRNGTNAGTLAVQMSSSVASSAVTAKIGSSCFLTQL